MKTILSLFAAFALVSCANLQQLATPENARIATSFVCTKALRYAVSDADRTEVAKYLYSAAVGVRSLSGSNGVPTPAQLNTTIKSFLKPGSKWNAIADDITGIWSVIYPSVHGTPAKAWQWLEQIAAGIEDSASQVMPPH